MKRLYCAVLALACLILLSCGNSNILRVSAPRSTVVGHVDGKYLIIEGAGGDADRQIPEGARGNAKLAARRAAILDAQRNTLRYLGLAKKVRRGSVEYERVEGIVKGSQVAREEWSPDNQFRITLKVPLNGQGSLAEGLNYKKIVVRQ